MRQTPRAASLSSSAVARSACDRPSRPGRRRPGLWASAPASGRPRAARVSATAPLAGLLGLAAALALAVVAAGCAASTLRYTPERQPAGILLSADYAVAGDRLRVEVDTGGYRLEWAEILRPDGREVRAETIEHPGVGRSGSGFGIGVGVGTARRTGSVGVGGGVGVGTTVGGGEPRPEATTVAVFPLEAAGPAPWRLRVKVVGIEPVVIVLDPGQRG